MSNSWKVHAGGKQVDLTLSEDNLTLDTDGQVLRLRPEAWGDVQFPNAYCASFPLENQGRVQVGFSSREEQKAFAAEFTKQLKARGMSTLQLPPAGPALKVALYTIAEIPGRRAVAALGMVTAESVMSRGMFSDAGSDLKSLVGGNLAGIERAVREATDRARTKLAHSASSMGADAVVGISMSIAGIGDKAEAIVMAGTAVRTVSEPAAKSESRDGE
jgi:uncharacterized protein YbjQ (UPF0145 family)